MGCNAPGGAVPVQYQRSAASHVGPTYGPDVIACRACYTFQEVPGCAGAGAGDNTPGSTVPVQGQGFIVDSATYSPDIVRPNRSYTIEVACRDGQGNSSPGCSIPVNNERSCLRGWI